MLNYIDYMYIAIFIKKDNNIFYSKKILDIFNCNKNRIEQVLFNIKEIKNKKFNYKELYKYIRKVLLLLLYNFFDNCHRYKIV
jgi:hypothetical protein